MERLAQALLLLKGFSNTFEELVDELPKDFKTKFNYEINDVLDLTTDIEDLIQIIWCQIPDEKEKENEV